MSDKQNPTVAALRDSLSDAWKDLSKDKQDTIKKVVSEIEAMAATVAQQQTALETALEGQPLPEAHSSASVYMVDPATKANVLFTFRGHTDTDVERRVVDFLTRITGQQTAQHWLTQDAYRDANWGNKVSDKQPQQQGQPVAAPAQAQQTGNVAEHKTETFNAELLTATTIDEKTYWKVKGGRYQKYGVTIWPEVLEAAGFDFSALDPQQEYDISGRVATVQFKDDGKIDKVIELK